MKDLLTIIKRLVLQDAENRRQDAGYGGHMHDGGAASVEAQVKFYEYGQKGVVPPEWKEHEIRVRNEADPEWAEHQRLQEKFKS